MNDYFICPFMHNCDMYSHEFKGSKIDTIVLNTNSFSCDALSSFNKKNKFEEKCSYIEQLNMLNEINNKLNNLPRNLVNELNRLTSII